MKHAEPYAFREPQPPRIEIPLKRIGWRERAAGWAFFAGLALLRLAELAVAAIVIAVSATYSLGRKLIGGNDEIY
jgi:hypothetical protein